MEQRYNNALAAIKDGSADSLKAIKEDVAELSKYYGSELWKQDFAADEAGILPRDLKRGVLSEDGIWNLLSDYRDLLPFPELPGIHALHPVEEAGEGGDFGEMKLIGDLGDAQ